MSRKVFTAGEVLAAADVNNFLMDQTVMSFAGTAARGSAIPTPVEGMVTYLEDIDDLRTYNGSSWVSPFGLTKVYGGTFSSVAAFSLPNNTFTTQFDNYLLMCQMSISSGNGFFFRVRSGGTDNSSSNYNYALQEKSSSTTAYVAVNANSVTNNRLGFIADGEVGSLSLIIRDPLSSARKNFQQDFVRNVASGTVINNETGASSISITTPFDSLTLLAGSGTISGTVWVYGYRKN